MHGEGTLLKEYIMRDWERIHVKFENAIISDEFTEILLRNILCK